MSAVEAPVLTVYGRSYCHLCSDMMAALEALKPQYGFVIEWVDIEDDDPLEARFGEWVPVLMAGDEEICHYHLDPLRLDAHFAQMR